MVDTATGSAKLGVDIPEFSRRFQNYVGDITGPCFSCGLVFNVDVVSVMLNTNNPVTGSPLQIPFAWLFVFKIYTVSNLKGRVVSGSSLLSG